jgi:hypothetical protein
MLARKVLFLLVLVITLLFSAFIWFYPPSDDFEADNPFWNGISTFSAQTKTSSLNSLDNLPTLPKGTTLIIVPYEAFQEKELLQIRNYISNGGTLVLLDDYGFGNQILSALSLKIRFTNQVLLDPLYDYHNQKLPKITDFKSTPLTTNVKSIVFNHATSLNQTDDSTIIAESSTFSFLDINNNGVRNPNEPYGPFPEAAYTKINQGYIVLLADPSLIINSMINLDDNLQFIKNVESIQGSNSQVFIDQAHLPKSALDNGKTILAEIYVVATYPYVTLALIAIILAFSLKNIWRKT